MCIANIESLATIDSDELLQSAITTAVSVQPRMREAVEGEIDSLSIALSCADRAIEFHRAQPAYAAVLLLAATAIQHERKARLLAEFQAELNKNVITGRKAG